MVFNVARNDKDDIAVSAIRTERLHNLEKVQLKGTAVLYSGWTFDDEVEITMLYSDTSKPCPIDVSKSAVLVKYQVTGTDGKIHFGWQLQPNFNDAGCLLEFASFRPEDKEEGHSE
jgi:hypothetical protein